MNVFNLFIFYTTYDNICYEIFNYFYICVCRTTKNVSAVYALLALYVVHCTMYTVRCTHSTLYDVHCTMYTVRHTLYIYTVRRTVYVVQCTSYSVLHTLGSEFR